MTLAAPAIPLVMSVLFNAVSVMSGSRYGRGLYLEGLDDRGGKGLGTMSGSFMRVDG